MAADPTAMARLPARRRCRRRFAQMSLHERNQLHCSCSPDSVRPDRRL